MIKFPKFLVYIFIALLFNTNLFAINQIKIVGSGTVYPFSSTVTENFIAKNKSFDAPIVESTGTGGGFKMFCQGAGLYDPDINNASRQIKSSELEICKKNGVNDILEISFGYDSIVLIQPKSLSQISLTSEQIFLALATQIPSTTGSLIANPYKNWSEIDSSLPNIPIKVIGPASLSGTKEAFTELVMEKACKKLYKAGKLKVEEKDLGQVCKSIRTDGAYINGGENYILFINKVSASEDTLGIIGYSFYQQNERIVSAVIVDGVQPNKDTLEDKTYSLIRPLYFYVKKDKIGLVRGLKEFIEESTSKDAIGQNGYLKRNGLIPLSEKEYNDIIKKINL